MQIAALLIAVLAFPTGGQTVNGVKPIPDPTPLFAKAFVKRITEDAVFASKPDMFAAGYFSMKVKMMIPLTQTKYTAAQIGVCGTMLGLYDPELSKTIKAASDRITKGDKDFDSFTKPEQEAINKAIANETSPLYPLGKTATKESHWEYMSGAFLGAVCAYSTLWHLSPKHAMLLTTLAESTKACAEQASEPEAAARKDIVAGLSGFAKFQGKTFDEATMLEVSKQVEATLKSSLPEKYRW
jgi:hypothetical protein